MKRVKCFMVRHQAEGVMHSKVYSTPPSADEMAADAAELKHRHGLIHSGTLEPYWVKVHESVMLVPDEISDHFIPADDELPEPAIAELAGESGVAKIGISSPRLVGTGTVTNPGA